MQRKNNCEKIKRRIDSINNGIRWREQEGAKT